MKLIKLLLIGLLPTVSLLACCDNDALIPPSSKLRIVADIDNGTPELYGNTTITLKAIDVNGNQTKATWGATDTDGVELSYVPLTGVTAETVDVKVINPATAQGIITATYVIPSAGNVAKVIHTAKFAIFPSTEAVKSITVTPSTKEILIPHDDASATQAFVATATFTDNKTLVVTTDVDWSLPTVAGGLTVETNTGVVTATTDTTATILTAKLTSITEVIGTANITAKKEPTPVPPYIVKSFTIAGKGGGILPSTTGTLQMQVIETLATGGEQPPKDIVAGDSYTCTVDNTFGEANIDKDTCIVTGISDGGVTVIATTTNPDTAIKESNIMIIIPPPVIVKSFIIEGEGGSNMLPSRTGTLRMQVIETLATGGEQPPKDIVAGDGYTCTAQGGSNILDVDKDTCIVTGIAKGSVMVTVETTNPDSDITNSMTLVMVP